MLFVLKYILLLAILPIILLPTLVDLSADATAHYPERSCMNGLTYDPETNSCFLSHNETITVQTEKHSYDRGEIVIISGRVEIVSESSITVVVKSPLNSIIITDQLTVDNYGNFKTTLNLADSLYTYDGTHTITVFYGNPIETSKTKFELGDFPVSYFTLTTDKIFYDEGDTVVVNIQMNNSYSNTPINISLKSPYGIISTLQNITSDGITFTTNMNTGNNTSIYKQGIYTLTANYGDNTSSNTFDYHTTRNSLTITTDKPSYNEGDTIYITGQIQTPTNGTSVSISLVSNIDGSLGNIPNITTNNNNFSTSINTGNNTSISTEGTYTLTAHYGSDTSSTTFYYHIPTLEDEYPIPSSYVTLSDRQISKWTHELQKWENAESRTDTSIDHFYDKLDRATTRNQTNQIEFYTERIGHSIALSELYGILIYTLQEKLDLFS